MNKSYIQLISFAILILVSCEQKETSIDNNDPYDYLETFAYTVTTEEMKNLINDYNLDFLLSYVEYDVSVHHVSYSTTYNNSSVLASGAICIPITTKKLPIVSYQHGTMFDDEETPSGFTELSSFGMELFATNGYITFISDYIGYGSTKNIIHPYHLYKPSADAVIDMIFNGLEFLKTNQISFDTSGIYLAGFSEGGYVTFATQKKIETHPEYNLTIKASAPGAGAYELEYMFDITTENDYYQGPGYMGLAILAYNDYYWNQPLDYYFNVDYIDEVERVFDGSYTESEIHNSFPKYLSEFLNSDFLNDFKNNPASQFRVRLIENSLNNWVLNSPTKFIHGSNDQVVPYAVAQKTYNDLITLGVSSNNLILQSFNGGHNGSTYLALALDWFRELDE